MEGGKLENPEKNPQSKDENQQQTRPTCDRESNPGHSGGRRVLSPLRHPCSPIVSRYFEQFREQRHAKSSYFGTSVTLSDAILRSLEGNSIRHRDLTLEVITPCPAIINNFLILTRHLNKAPFEENIVYYSLTLFTCLKQRSIQEPAIVKRVKSYEPGGP